MNREDIIRMAKDSGLPRWYQTDEVVNMDLLGRFAAIVAAAEREKVAQWMIQRGYPTGHGDTIEDLLGELDLKIVENWLSAMVTGVETEREACAKVCEAIDVEYEGEDVLATWCADAIRKRGAP